jgi:hypothetical protein
MRFKACFPHNMSVANCRQEQSNENLCQLIEQAKLLVSCAEEYRAKVQENVVKAGIVAAAASATIPAKVQENVVKAGIVADAAAKNAQKAAEAGNVASDLYIAAFRVYYVQTCELDVINMSAIVATR